MVNDWQAIKAPTNLPTVRQAFIDRGLSKKFIVQVLISFSACPQSNNLIFETINTDHGLSQNQVICIYQDSKGLLWVGTQDRLNMYDGYKFKVFRHEPGNPNSLSDYAVNKIFESESGIS